MATWNHDGRTRVQALEAKLDASGELPVLRSPIVGAWRDQPAPGSVLAAGDRLGVMVVLGAHLELRVPAGAHGAVVPSDGARLAKRPVQYGDVLVTLDPEGAGPGAGATADTAADAETGLVVPAPSSGRFYSRPSPEKPPFVSVGDVIESGQTVGLLEVMKTFHRVPYSGPGLPSPARVVAVVPSNEDDVDEGAALIRVEPA